METPQPLETIPQEDLLVLWTLLVWKMHESEHPLPIFVKDAMIKKGWAFEAEKFMGGGTLGITRLGAKEMKRIAQIIIKHYGKNYQAEGPLSKEAIRLDQTWEDQGLVDPGLGQQG